MINQITVIVLLLCILLLNVLLHLYKKDNELAAIELFVGLFVIAMYGFFMVIL